MQKYIGICSLILLAACSSDSGNGLNDGWMNYRNTGVPTNNNGIASMIQNDELKLENAEFTMSNSDAGYGDTMRFSVDNNGIVTGLKFGAGEKEQTFVRSGNTALFRKGPNTGNNISLTSGTFVNSSSKVKLQYSDFGRIAFTDGTDKFYATYTGGYKEKEITTKPTTGDMTFSGRAVGYVHGRDNTKDPLNVGGNATLTFKDGKENLTAGFDNWYTVKVDGNGKMTFSGYENGDNNYKFNNTTDVNGSFNSQYYGDGGVPSEVTGSFGYAEEGAAENDAGVKLDAVFGGVKQP